MRDLRKRIAERAEQAESEELIAEAETAPVKKPKKKKRKKASISTHAIFVPLLTVWGAALAGLCVFVAPPSALAAFRAVPFVGGLPHLAKIGVAAVAGALLALFVALIWRKVAAKPAAKKAAAAKQIASEPMEDAVEPIDPVADLGVDSLDTPLSAEEAEALEALEDRSCEPASDPLVLFEDQICEAHGAQVPAEAAVHPETGNPVGEFAEPAAESHQEVAQLADQPREVDLAEFGAMPGRSGVWIEEQAPEAEPETQLAAEEDENRPLLAVKPDRDAPTALAKLRQVHPKDLSMVQMVERFAAALHDRQEAELNGAVSRKVSGSETALADALKALDMFSESGFHPAGEGANDELQSTTRELRDALSKLRTLSGAA